MMGRRHNEKGLRMEENTAIAEQSPLRVEVVNIPDADYGALGKPPLKSSLLGKVIRTVAAIAIALASFFVAAPVFSDPEFHADTIAVLDEKKANAAGLAAAAAGASVAIELVAPDDVAKSMASELADLSSDFGIIVVAILLEKYLLTVLALVSFMVMLPVACLLYVLGVWRGEPGGQLFHLSAKVLLLSLVLVLVVPASAQVSQIIDETFETSLVVSEAENVELGLAMEADTDEETVEQESWWGFLTDFVDDTVDTVTDTVTGAKDWVSTALSRLTEAFAVMLITSCIIPILVLFLALWLVNLILGIDTSGTISALRGRAWREPMRARRGEFAGAVKSKDASGVKE